MTTASARNTPFGVLLRERRRTRGISQLELAGVASSTPRHISFLETGRSRPGRPMVLKLCQALALPPRESNELLVAAGLPPAYTEHTLDADELGPYRTAVNALLDSHEPFPACAVDRWGQVLVANDAFERLNPGVASLSPEQLVVAIFGSEEGRQRVLNWQEIAWAYVDRMSALALRSADDRIEGLVDMVRGYLGDDERSSAGEDPHVLVRFRVDETTVLTTFTTFLRFDNANDVGLSELTVELVFPADDATRQYLEHTAS